MDFIELLKVIFLGIVEGITEWLPVSSTGHLILVEEFIKLNVSEAFWEMFMVVIQLGAIMAVVVLYFKELWPFQNQKKAKGALERYVKTDKMIMWFKIVVSCIPSIVIGLPFNDFIEAHFNNYLVVSIMLIVYGIFFILIENAILQSRSPSCGVKEIYDGTFSGTKIPGQGVFAKMLMDEGIRVLDAGELPKIILKNEDGKCQSN